MEEIIKEKGDYLDRFKKVADGLELSKNIAEKLANFIHYEVSIAKISQREDIVNKLEGRLKNMLRNELKNGLTDYGTGYKLALSDAIEVIKKN